MACPALVAGGRVDIPILWLRRGDKESAVPSPPQANAGVVERDWLPRRPGDASAGLSRLFERALDRVARTNQRALLSLYDAVARQQLRHGISVLARAEVVVTDRLHGHILSVLLGKPNVALDNSDSKVKSFFETWTGPAGAGQWAASPEEALAQARQLRAQLR